MSQSVRGSQDNMECSEATYIRVEELPSAALDKNAIVVLSADFATYFGLEDSALKIWELIASEASLTSIVDRLTAEFDVDRATCVKDTQTFLDNLIAHGIAKRIEHS